MGDTAAGALVVGRVSRQPFCAVLGEPQSPPQGKLAAGGLPVPAAVRGGAGLWFRGEPAGECFGFAVQYRSGETEARLLETRRLWERQCVKGGVWVGAGAGV